MPRSYAERIVSLLRKQASPQNTHLPFRVYGQHLRIVVMAKAEAVPTYSDPLWYKDAIIYEVHVRAFQDSNGDGIGDFRGLTQRLDYLRDLGVTAIWLLPFY